MAICRLKIRADLLRFPLTRKSENEGKFSTMLLFRRGARPSPIPFTNGVDDISPVNTIKLTQLITINRTDAFTKQINRLSHFVFIYHRHCSTRFFHSIGRLHVKTVLLLSDRPSPLDKRRHTSSIPRREKPLYSSSISNSNTRCFPFFIPKSHALSALMR